jgi:hypothetical protein
VAGADDTRPSPDLPAEIQPTRWATPSSASKAVPAARNNSGCETNRTPKSNRARTELTETDDATFDWSLGLFDSTKSFWGVVNLSGGLDEFIFALQVRSQ